MSSRTRAAMLRFTTLSPSRWPVCLDALRELGFDTLDLPLVWREHQRADGDVDFTSARLDVSALLGLIEARGMRAIVRLGPGCAPDAAGLGLPEAILRDRDCQARTRRQNPVVVLDAPRLVPLPSMASARYREAAARWVSAACEVIAPFVSRGTITHVAVGHGPDALRRDDALELDHHPDGPEGDDLVARETAIAVSYLEGLAAAAQQAGIPRERVMLTVAGSATMSCVAETLSKSWRLVCGLPLPEAGSEAIWRHARLLMGLPHGAHVDLRVGCHPWDTPRRASYTTPAARLALAAGLTHTTAVMGAAEGRWVGALLDEHGAPRAHAPRWKALLREAEALPDGEEVGLTIGLPAWKIREARANTRLRPLPMGLLGMRDVTPTELWEADPLRVAETAFTARAIPWRWAYGEHALDPQNELWVQGIAPTLHPAGGALIRAVRTHDGAAMVVAAARDEAVTVTPPPGRWTDGEGRDVEACTVQPGESVTLFRALDRAEVRW